MVRGAIWVLCRVWTRPDGWRRRPSQWPAHNVLHHQHVDLWGIYPTKPEVGVYKLQPILQWNLVNFYSSSCMFLSCNLCVFFEFIFVDLQIVIPGCLYQLPNKLEWIDSFVFSLGLTWQSQREGRSTDEDQDSFLTSIILECSYCYTDVGRAQV